MNKKQDITQVVDSHLCHSCGACFASCGHDSISFSETVGGYIFPNINYDSCTNCGLCFEVCSGDHFGKTLQELMPSDPFVGTILDTLVGVATDKQIFDNSQSGGVTTALLAQLLDSGQIEVAIVATMSEQTPPRGDVVLVQNSSELMATQKSKYTPIPLLHVLPEIKHVKGAIAIVGLSCHIQSLYNLCDTYPWLRKKEILKIGLICDRVMTAHAIDFMAFKATKEPVKNFVFRDKNRPAYPGNPTVTTISNKEIVMDKALRMSMKDFFTPARCRLCFDKLNVFADIVCGDPHGVDGIDRERGETLVFARTPKGQEVLQNAKDAKQITLRNTSTQQAIRGQKIDQKRADFAAYISAWSDMGRKTPNYPFELKTQEFSKQKESLQHALSLDSFSSKEELLKSADAHYRAKQRKQTLLLPLRAVRAILKMIKQKIVK